MFKYWGVVLSLVVLGSCKEEQPSIQKEEIAENISVEETVTARLFGFDLSNFIVEHDTIKRGDSFGEIMIQNKVDYPKITKLTQDFKDTFDVRKIRVGKPYLILKSKDTTETAQVFIYENDPINYTVVDFRDSVTAYRKQRKVKYIDREASGIIQNGNSLSQVILDQGIDYNVTQGLSEIYAWTIDFFKLQEGDKFKVIYREKYINDSIYAGAEPIEAAYFEHNGRPIYAFSYQPDPLKSRADYYDDEANNLRRTFLKAPIKFNYRISSKYNLTRRIRYYGYKVKPHKGTDYAAGIGTPIIATADGTVIESTRKGGNGNYVKIRHNSTYDTQYLHMKKQNVKKGQYVHQGDVIGWVGMTGNTAGPHVCYRFWRNGSQVDPLKEELPLAEPLAESLRDAYFAFINPKKEQLDCIEYPQPILDPEMITLNQ